MIVEAVQDDSGLGGEKSVMTWGQCIPCTGSLGDVGLGGVQMTATQ